MQKLAGGIGRALAVGLAGVVCAGLLGVSGTAQERSAEYARVQARLARGWNTWDTNSVLNQVLLPEGLAVQVGVKHRTTEGSDGWLPAALIGRQGRDVETVVPGPHAYDGSYTELKLEWRGQTIRVRSGHDGDDLVWLAEPGPSTSDARGRVAHLPEELVIGVGMLWNRPGAIEKKDGRVTAELGGRTVSVFLAGKDAEDAYVPVTGAYFSSILTGPVGISSGRPRTVGEIEAALEQDKAAYEHSLAALGKNAPVADAIETVLGWDTIYEPQGQRVISPVSRIWSVGWGGYVLFDWDTYFAATLAAVGDRDLAYANAEEIGREAATAGFVPNYARAGGWKSQDRSEPPVGAMTVLGLYRKFHDRWLLEDTFAELLRWNRWWAEHRDDEGYLVWGSDGENEPANLDDSTRGTRAGAILESGLDNSPMYDGATYDPERHQLLFADVGLMSMYIEDCDALAEIAGVLGKGAEQSELQQRAEKYRASLGRLWDEKTGLFLNKDLKTGELSHRISPTNFYPLLAKAATAEQARRMVSEHLLNPKEFWGEWVIPSIARDDPAFHDQNYWRGRIWGPMNYLVDLGMRRYSEVPEVDAARRQVEQKSLALFLRDWKAQGHVHENYNGMTGEGDDVTNSDRFYHWGALLGLMGMEN